MERPLVAAVVDPGRGLGLASIERRWFVTTDDPVAALFEVDAEVSPRWVWWGRETTQQLASNGSTANGSTSNGSTANGSTSNGSTPIDRCWDILAVHRLLYGGWRTSIGQAWAALHGLDAESLPQMGQMGLLDVQADEGDAADPVRPDGHLRPEWTSGGWRSSPEKLAIWAELALRAAGKQAKALGALPDPSRAQATARSESAAELLCAEMANDGLPVNTAEALRLIEESAGRRPTSLADEDTIRAHRDEAVLSKLVPRQKVNLRNPADVKSMLHRAGLDLPDTKAWRLKEIRDTSPLIDTFLHWRKAERIATTYGYSWFDEHITGGRLRGDWSSADGAAGRMTASAGLHNLPVVMRPIVEADPGYVFVRADLGQIEPRVLAAVSGDEDLIAATQGDDLYQPVAERLGVTRAIAKLAVLGAMYGATTGESAHALTGLKKNYPVAMGLLDDAAQAGKAGDDVFTSGGRRIRMWVDPSIEGDIDKAISVAASRGRYARNAIIQGAAAELFKVWAITVRRRARPFDAAIVLCLHDELLVHAPVERAQDVAGVVDAALQEAAHYWSPRSDVRFLADVSQIQSWSEAK